ncbi:hypothetical protein IGI67_005070 [Enterococcus sp. AZ196]
MSFYEDLWIRREFEKSQKMFDAKVKHRDFIQGNKRKNISRKNKVRRVQNGR